MRRAAGITLPALWVTLPTPFWLITPLLITPATQQRLAIMTMGTNQALAIMAAG